MANLADVNNNLFPVAHETYMSTLSAGIAAGASQVPLADSVGYDDGDVVVLIVDPKTPDEAVFTGVIEGNTVVQVEWTEGNTGVSHEQGAPVADYITATHLSMVTKGILKEHNPNGSHKNLTTGSLSTNAITVPDDKLEIDSPVVVDGSVRSTPRATVVASTGALAPNIDNFGIYDITALAENLTISNPIGTVRNGDAIVIRIKDNGTTRTIGYGTAYVNISGLDTVTATTPNKWTTIGMMYNATVGKWHISSFATEA